MLSVPTGLGKTAGVVLASAWQRTHRPAGEVPRHLVYCLPMRVLVRQTRNAVVRWLAKIDLLSGQSTETDDGISYEARFDRASHPYVTQLLCVFVIVSSLWRRLLKPI